MKHENDVSNMVGCLQVVKICSFIKETKVYIRASYIVFIFVKTENNFIKEIKHVTLPSSPGENPRRSLPNFRLGFHQARKAQITCFISYIFILSFKTFLFDIYLQLIFFSYFLFYFRGYVFELLVKSTLVTTIIIINGTLRRCFYRNSFTN